MGKRLIWAQYTGFLTIGILANIVALLLINIRSDITMNYSQAGFILSGQFLGMFMTVLLGGFLADKFGKKPYIMVGSIIISIGLVWSMLSGNYIQLLLSCILTGIGFGAYEAGMSALCVDTHEKEKGNAMNLLSFFYALGAILIPGFVALCLRYVGNWRLIFGLIAILPVIVAFLLYPVKVKHEKEDIVPITAEPFKTSYLWFIGLSSFTYVGTEAAAYGWLPTLWGKGQLNSLVSASMIISIFWITITLGRLIAGRIADKIGLSKYLIFSSIATMLTCIGWWLIPLKIWPLISVIIIGFTLSGIFPIIIASAGISFPKNTGTVTAFVLTFGSLGGFIVPLLTGKLADIFGIEVVLIVISFSSLLMVIFTYLAWGLKKPLKNIKYDKSIGE